jgi:hypothetical protein
MIENFKMNNSPPVESTFLEEGWEKALKDIKEDF